MQEEDEFKGDYHNVIEMMLAVTVVYARKSDKKNYELSIYILFY